MPPAYNEVVLAMNSDLLKQIEINKKKTGFTINDAGEVSNEDLFPSIISTHEDYFFQKKKNGDRINLLSRFQ